MWTCQALSRQGFYRVKAWAANLFPLHVKFFPQSTAIPRKTRAWCPSPSTWSKSHSTISSSQGICWGPFAPRCPDEKNGVTGIFCLAPFFQKERCDGSAPKKQLVRKSKQFFFCGATAFLFSKRKARLRTPIHRYPQTFFFRKEKTLPKRNVWLELIIKSELHHSHHRFYRSSKYLHQESGAYCSTRLYYDPKKLPGTIPQEYGWKH